MRPIALPCLIILVGCAIPPTQHPTPIAASKSDATVTLMAEYDGAGERPRWGDASTIALERCAAWGFTGAEVSGPRIQTCLQGDNFGCHSFREQEIWQCTGQPG